MTLNLNELKRLAELDARNGDWFAANPATILALIARIEEAETRNALQQRALDEMRDAALEEAAIEINTSGLDQRSMFEYLVRALKSTTNGAGGQG